MPLPGSAPLVLLSWTLSLRPPAPPALSLMSIGRLPPCLMPQPEGMRHTDVRGRA